MTRVAAIDCGTNSIRLLIAESVDGVLVDLDRQMQIVRLGQGVDATGRLAPEALERTFTAARGYAAAIAASGAERVRVVATSATRDAANRDEFVTGMTDLFGVVPEVVPGEVEAALSFSGATAGLAAAGVEAPYLVLDLGGGSTEFVLGTTGPEAARSVDVGCVRMLERHLHDDPPTAAQVAAAVADIDAAIADAMGVVPVGRARSIVGVAGTVTTVAALALDLPTYDSDKIHQARIAASRVHEVTAQLRVAGREQRAALGPVHPGRVDTITAGALVLDRIVTALGDAALVASEHDILDGIALSLL